MKVLLTFIFLLIAETVLAATVDPLALGGVASNITANFAELAKLITSGAYIAGMGFSVGAILKFKAHKDNPTQIPIGTPIALVFIAAALIFLPSIFTMSGHTLFGTNSQVGGASGKVAFIS